MIIKKYIATTEKEAVSLAKAELGEDVTIMNIKEKNGISIQFSLCKQFCRIPHKRRLIGYAGCHIRLHHMCQ